MISIVIPAFGHAKDLKRSIDRLIEVTKYPFSLVVVLGENHPANKYLNELSNINYMSIIAKTCLKKMSIVTLSGKFNFADMIRSGVKQAGDKNVIIMDESAIVPAGWANTMFSEMSTPANASRNILISVSPEMMVSIGKIPSSVINTFSVDKANNTSGDVENKRYNFDNVMKASHFWLFKDKSLIKVDASPNGFDDFINLYSGQLGVMNFFVHYIVAPKKRNPGTVVSSRPSKITNYKESDYPAIANGEQIAFISEGALGDTLFGVPAMKFLRRKYGNLTVVTNDRPKDLLAPIFPSIRFTTRKELVKAKCVFVAPGFLAAHSVEGPRFPVVYPSGCRIYTAHCAFQNLRNVGASIWDLDYSPEFNGFKRPDFFKPKTVLMVNGTWSQEYRLWDAKEMNATASKLKREGFFVVNMFWTNGCKDVPLISPSHIMKNPLPKDVLNAVCNADLMISNDTGIAHLRALFGKPAVQVWAGCASVFSSRPLAASTRTIVGSCPRRIHGYECYTFEQFYDCKDRICRSIKSEDVMEEVHEMCRLRSIC